MTSRRTFLTLAGGTVLAITLPKIVLADEENTPEKLIALNQIYGDGAKWVGVAIQYNKPLQAADLPRYHFLVQNRKVLGLYVTDSLENGAKNEGKFVILNLDPQDETANLLQKNPPSRPAKFKAGEKTDNSPEMKSVNGSVIINGRMFATDENRTAIADDFKQESWQDPATGKTVKYNLFVPKNYQFKESYPLVLFMHDAGITGKKTKAPLYQGLGAVVWASPAVQTQSPAFVLAPAFDEIVADDDGQTSDYLDAIINLIKYLATQYNIDTSRLYATGQSGGGMLAIAMNIRYPDFFAASYLVACQWDPAKVAPMAKNKLWISVSEDDNKAFPTQTGLTQELEKQGAKVARAVWDARWSQEEFQQAYDQLTAADANVYFVAFRKGSVFADGENSSNPGAGHMNTWKYAYSIAPVRDWLLSQRKSV
ncbi:alpha/beta hydrolase-fold protein [Bisgaard Taxon 10/6]|uniref:prolyl oligopeptidase family serine peptidase n=1 Tax=Exercitatus varius TaxID=67857 RepID=UPI00294B2DAA|nr:prolyl oligopeptidase family serine peptidase [Exercitatus varius]MDG2917988.1 alpha/beta hydrolase-fold protein [Exercitatus varius]